MNSKIEKIIKQDFFCIMPWVNLHIATNGDLRLCCKSNFKKYTVGNIYDFDIESGFNTEELIKVRKKMINGHCIPHCHSCFDSEKKGDRSLRGLVMFGEKLDYFSRMFGYENSNDFIAEIIYHKGKWNKTPFFLDIKPGNICNLQCRMCGPSSSSQIGKKGKKNQKIEWLNEEKNFLKVTKLIKNVVHLKIGGGEPALMKSTYRLLDYCVEKGVSKKMLLDITTNGLSVHKLYKYIKHFYDVNIIFSIDAVEEIYEYIRFPAKWKEAEKSFENTLKLKNTQVNVNLVVQLLNIFSIEDYIDWVDRMSEIKTFSVNVLLLDKPDYFSVFLLKRSSRYRIAENIRIKISKSKNIDQKTIDYFLSLSNKLEQDGFEEQKRKKLFERFFIENDRFDYKRKQHLPEKLLKLREEEQKGIVQSYFLRY